MASNAGPLDLTTGKISPATGPLYPPWVSWETNTQPLQLHTRPRSTDLRPARPLEYTAPLPSAYPPHDVRTVTGASPRTNHGGGRTGRTCPPHRPARTITRPARDRRHVGDPHPPEPHLPGLATDLTALAPSGPGLPAPSVPRGVGPSGRDPCLTRRPCLPTRSAAARGFGPARRPEPPSREG